MFLLQASKIAFTVSYPTLLALRCLTNLSLRIYPTIGRKAFFAKQDKIAKISSDCSFFSVHEVYLGPNTIDRKK
jgi:hypothetical protein